MSAAAVGGDVYARARRLSLHACRCSYATTSEHYRRLLHDKPLKARELVTRWTRFLLAHRVDLTMRSVNFWQHFHLDILAPALAALVLTLFAVVWLVGRLLKLYYWSCCGMGKTLVHKKLE